MKYHSVAITGHRPNKLPWGENEGSMRCVTFALSLKLQIVDLIEQGYDTFYTGMSWGVDMIFGEQVAQLKTEHPHIRLIGVLPFEGMHAEWPESYQERFFRLVEACDEVVELNLSYHEDCYKQRNQYLVDYVDRLIAVVNPRNRRSGSMQTVGMAKRKGITITFIDLKTLKRHTLKGRPALRIVK
jgi:uncharacterized phage-like protein YoqJ